jgi:hypothetical protein
VPEHIDPFRELENFGSGGIVTTPLEPSEVRRLGNKHRTQRRARIAGAVAAVLVAAVVPVAVIASQGDGKAAPSPTDKPSATVSPAAPKVVTYPGNGVMVSSPQESDKLTGTSVDFQSFIGDQARQAQESGAACPDAAHGVTVTKWSSAGYAVGDYNDCGGYQALWVDLDGTWVQGAGGNDVWNCTTLDYLAVPRDFAGECAAEAGGFGPAGTANYQLGMSPAQIVAAGGSVGATVAGTSCGRLYEYEQPSSAPNGIDGLLREDVGLVQINARPDDITPERISLGSTYAQTKAAYPALHRDAEGWVVPLPGQAEYRFDFTGSGPRDTVSSMILLSTKASCTS